MNIGSLWLPFPSDVIWFLSYSFQHRIIRIIHYIRDSWHICYSILISSRVIPPMIFLFVV